MNKLYKLGQNKTYNFITRNNTDSEFLLNMPCEKYIEDFYRAQIDLS